MVGSAAYGAAPYPVCGTAVVDGNSAEWVAGDFFANMYTAGNTKKPVLAKAHLRYQATTETMYVMVAQVDANKPLLVQSEEAYVKVGTPSPSTTAVSDQTNNDGTPPDWAWVGLGYAGTRDGHNTARAFEASFKIPQGTYRLNIHVNVWTSENETAAVEGRNIQLVIDCRDYGDLPDVGAGVGSGDYQTLSARGGANHLIVPNLRLGAAIDAEADGQPGAAAAGDDAAGGTTDDEDAINTLHLTDMLRGLTRQVNVSVFNFRTASRRREIMNGCGDLFRARQGYHP